MNTWTQFGYVGGGSGALAGNCSSLPCTIDVSDIVPLKAAANTWTGANDFSTASKTAPFRIGASDPAACDPASREFFFNISSNALKSCNTANTWTAIGGGAAGYGSFGAGSPWAPFGWNVGSSGDIYAGDSPGAQVCAAVVPPLNATFTKVGLYVLGWPTSGGQGLSVGLYNAAGTRLGYASALSP
ncbi:MAG TPA: hypothetical protein VM120_04175, partial [Bryobacteraceae bacterium]|nr:hypothetical protein [Bryobacteraceae bacterium]